MNFKLLSPQKTVLLLLPLVVVVAEAKKSVVGKAQIHMDIPTDAQLQEEFAGNGGPDQRQQQDQNKFTAFLEEEEHARKVLQKNNVMQGTQMEISEGRVAIGSDTMEGLIESASVIVLALFVLTLAFLCLFWVLRAFPDKRSGEGSIQHMDGKEYEDLKLEYIRRKTARNEKMSKEDYDDEVANSMMTGSGSTTQFTDNNQEENRGQGIFGQAMNFIFSEQSNQNNQNDGVELSTRDLM